MIPTSTPPGTLIVYAHPDEPPDPALVPIPMLEHRKVYTLAKINRNRFGYYTVELEEVGILHKVSNLLSGVTWAYPIACFELAVLPSVVREIFTQVPAQKETQDA